MSEKSSPEQPPFKLRDLTFSVYAPSLLHSIGSGAVTPFLILFALDLGASAATATFLVALRGIGTMAFDLPAGLTVSKWGDKAGMIAGTLMAAVVAVFIALSPSLLVFAGLSFIMGGAGAFWQLARIAYVSEVAPLHFRGRALSIQAGMNRAGAFAGPIIGGFFATNWGLETTFYVQAVFGVLAAAMMFVVVRESTGSERMAGRGVAGRIVNTMVDHKSFYLSAGLPTATMQVLRSGRTVFIPLWGEHLGLEPGVIGAVFAISSSVDMLLFYPNGILMDRVGRKWAGVPGLLIMGLSFVLLPLTTDVYTFVAVATLGGLGNGISTGINATLGADFAPAVGRGEFLGVWRLIQSMGSAGGPFAVSLLIGVGSVGVASLACGGLGFVAGAVMAAFVPEPLKRRREAEAQEVVARSAP